VADIPDEYMYGPAFLVAGDRTGCDPAGGIPAGGMRLVQLLDQ